MATRLLQDLISKLSGEYQILTKVDNSNITGISFDSRNCRAGDLFFAIPGVHVDGNDFVPSLLDSSPGAIIMSRLPNTQLIAQAQEKEIPLIYCSNIRPALAWISKEWYDNPDDRLTLIGVTGTDGKSSTVWYIQQLLTGLGISSGFISTVAMQTGTTPGPNSLRQSTPEAPEIFHLLNTMVTQGRTHGVIEATSHGLSEQTGRLAAIGFQTAVFTNITHEHLEFHGTFDQYLYDKANLFRKLKTNLSTGSDLPVAVINAQSPYAKYLAEAVGDQHKLLFYGIKALIPKENLDLPLTIWATQVEDSTNGVTGSIHYFDPPDVPQTIQVTLAIPGSFTLENLMGATLAVYNQSIKNRKPSIAEILRLVPKLQGVKGRMRIIQGSQPFSVMVDYAHTPGSFEKVFPLFRSITTGKLLALFGSGGERDQAKRPIQGKIAGTFADVLILSNEDPRLEDPMEILNEIAQGVDNPQVEVVKIVDRYKAICYAIQLAQPGDTLVLLGKGHEQSIIIGNQKTPWDEESKVREALMEAGYQLHDQN
jgi:UDP-N-acetylmuramoyl-L-alanyl-D-glutamate--2,6-diaminopimelate ligase